MEEKKKATSFLLKTILRLVGVIIIIISLWLYALNILRTAQFTSGPPIAFSVIVSIIGAMFIVLSEGKVSTVIKRFLGIFILLLIVATLFGFYWHEEKQVEFCQQSCQQKAEWGGSWGYTPAEGSRYRSAARYGFPTKEECIEECTSRTSKFLGF